MADLRALLESALSQHIAAETSATCYTGTDNETKAAPCVVVTAGDAEEIEPLSGVYRIAAACMAKSAAGGDTGAHDTLCAGVRNAYKIDTPSLITALQGYESGLKVYGTGEGDSVSTEQDGDLWTQTWTRDIVCCEA